MRNNNLAMLFIILLLPAAGFALGLDEEPTRTDSTHVTARFLETGEIPEKNITYHIKGNVRMVGNDPFIRIMLEDEQGRYFFFEPSQFSFIQQYVGQIIEVESELSVFEIRSASGQFITNEITILSPELQ